MFTSVRDCVLITGTNSCAQHTVGSKKNVSVELNLTEIDPQGSLETCSPDSSFYSLTRVICPINTADCGQSASWTPSFPHVADAGSALWEASSLA